jgi:hypothetical protein
MFGSSSSSSAVALAAARRGGAPGGGVLGVRGVVVATDPASVDAYHDNGGATVQTSSWLRRRGEHTDSGIARKAGEEAASTLR